MDITIKIVADLFVHSAEYLLRKKGLSVEHEVLELVKTASDLIWNNADPETDEAWIHWITSKELYIAECIGELHKESARKYLSL